MENRLTLDLNKQLEDRLRDHVKQHLKLVDCYSIAKVILTGSLKQTNVVNDYLHFCYAKSARSFGAISLLLQKRYREDAFIVLRTIYENYLHLCFVLDHPREVTSFVEVKVRKSIRELKHPDKGAGRHAEVIDPESGERYRYGKSIAGLAKSGSSRVSMTFHELFYEYLCEFTHNHFISFGGYLEPKDETKITARTSEKNLDVIMLSVLLSTMLMECFNLFEATKPKDCKQIQDQIKSSVEILTEVQDQMSYEGKYVTLMLEIKKITNQLGQPICP